ncbi:hypothetical protein [Roseibium algae]|uniref:Uncharacterized protein n=1 Tax=Roseibium algae TaxID=3123038 RepID=A0ABU8TEL9_9HYPH
MSMTELVRIIEDFGKGVRAYNECSRACRDQLKVQSDTAAAYFLLAIVAEKFVDTYDDQPLSSPIAEAEFKRFKGYVEQFEATERASDPSAKLDTLNRIADEIANHKLLLEETSFQ